MEKVVRVRIEEDQSLERLNALYEKGWKTSSIIQYRGSEYRNQYLFVLDMPEEEWESHRFDVDEDEDDDSDPKGARE